MTTLSGFLIFCVVLSHMIRHDVYCVSVKKQKSGANHSPPHRNKPDRRVH